MPHLDPAGVVHGVGIDSINDGRHDMGAVLGDNVQDGLEPALVGLAVRVKEQKDVA